MSEKFERTQLNDEQVENVAGGVVMYQCIQNDDYYLYSTKDRDTKYSCVFKDLKAIDAIIGQYNRERKPDADIIGRLLSEGLIQPM